MPGIQVRHFTAKQQELKGRIVQQQHIIKKSPCGSFRQTFCSLNFIKNTHPHVYCTCTYSYLSLMSLTFKLSWAYSFDSNVCYITYCFYTFVLEPFHSPPTSVLFSWMYFQTLHNVYRYLDCADKTAALEFLLQQGDGRERQRNRQNYFGNLGSSKYSAKPKIKVWLFKSTFGGYSALHDNIHV